MKTLLLINVLIAMLAGCGKAEAPQAVIQAPAAASAPSTPPPPPKPGYVLKDGGRYGYESGLTPEDKAAGKLVATVVMLAYAGKRNGKHQFLAISDQDMRSASPRWMRAFDWAPGDEFVRESVYYNGKFSEKTFVRANPKILIMAAMHDAESGFLDRYQHQRIKSKPAIYVFCDEKGGCGAESIN